MKRDEVRAQRLTPRGVEAVGERLGRPVAGRERFPRRLGAGLAVIRHRPLELQFEVLTEELPNAIDVAPLEGGWPRRRRWYRHVRLHHLEHLEQVAIRGPGRERDTAAGPNHARQLLRRRFRTAGEHHTARRYDRVTSRIVERRIFGAARQV